MVLNFQIEYMKIRLRNGISPSYTFYFLNIYIIILLIYFVSFKFIFIYSFNFAIIYFLSFQELSPIRKHTTERGGRLLEYPHD